MIRRLKKTLITILLIVTFVLLCGFDDGKERVIDDANLFTEHEAALLNSTIDRAIQDTGLDLVIYTNKNGVDEYDMQYFSDNYYDEHYYGFDTAGSGAILVIDMMSRQMYISTKGIAIWYMDDVDIEDILDDVQPKLSDGEYYDACNTFLKDVHSLAMKYIENEPEGINKWKNGKYTDYKDFYYDYVEQNDDIDYSVHEKVNPVKYVLGNPFFCFLISAAIGGITVLIMSFRQKSRMTVDGGSYMDRNSYNLKRRNDFFTHTHTVKHVIESSSGSGGGGGGGSFHSGGGGSHGGGGRGF